MADADTTIGIYSLPNEVLIAIFEHLVPDTVPTDFTGSLDEEHLQRRETLHNLCLVSKQLGIAAQEVLHYNVVITDGTQLFHLFRRLWNNPHLRGQTRSFACLVNPADPDVMVSAVKAWNKGFKGLSADVSHPLIQHFLDTGFIKLESVEEAGHITEKDPSPEDFPSLYVPQILLAGILAMQNGVQDLLLMTHPGKWPAGDADYELEDIIFSGPLTDGFRPSTVSLPEAPMSTVKSLKMIPGAKPLITGETTAIINPTSVRFWQLENVTRIEMNGDNGGWISLLLPFGKCIEKPEGPVPEGMVKVMSRITDLRLSNSNTSLRKMGALLSLFPNLRALRWDFRERGFSIIDMLHFDTILEDDSSDSDGDGPRFSMSKALKKAPKGLESLHIETVPDDYNGVTALMPGPLPEELYGLSWFENLKYLTIDIHRIISYLDRLVGDRVPPPFEQTLPSSLVRLDLIYRCTDNSIEDNLERRLGPMKVYFQVLRDFARCCSNTHPNLRSISIKTFHPVREAGNPSFRYTEEQFERLRSSVDPEIRELVSLFKKVGVTFEMHFVAFPMTCLGPDQFEPATNVQI